MLASGREGPAFLSASGSQVSLTLLVTPLLEVSAANFWSFLALFSTFFAFPVLERHAASRLGANQPGSVPQPHVSPAA